MPQGTTLCSTLSPHCTIFVRTSELAFGCDADKMTVMGHGYAAAILNFLLISPVAKAELDSFLTTREAAWYNFSRYICVSVCLSDDNF